MFPEKFAEIEYAKHIPARPDNVTGQKCRFERIDNLTNYKKDIPNLFTLNQICVLSNGLETRLGAFNASYDFFFEWLKVDSEKEIVDRKKIYEEGNSVYYFVQGLLRKEKLIDYIEVAKEIASFYSLPIVDLYNHSGFNTWTNDDFLSDGLHPTWEGHKRIGTMIAKEIQRYI